MFDWTYFIICIPRMQLYQDANWWIERQEQDIYLMLESGLSIGAWHEDQLIGFIRSVTDGRFRAYVVHHNFHRREIDRQLVNKMIEQLQHIDVISLFCEEHLIDFYDTHGFKRSLSQYVLHKRADRG